MRVKNREKLYLLLFLFVWSGNLLANELVRIATGEWPPYLSQELPDYGLASRIVTEAFKEAGIDVEYQFFPWNRSLEATRSGQLEATVGWEKSADRIDDFLFSEDPIIIERTVFFYAIDNPVSPDTLWQTNKLHKPLVGVTLGYDYGDQFMEAEKAGRFEVYRSASDEANFKLLINKRIDLFPMDQLVGMRMLDKHFTPAERQSIAYYPKVLRTVELFLLISKKTAGSAMLKQSFDKGMENLKSTGKLMMIQSDAGRY